MSEFISTCPKCRQQILCDTAYVGRRIACPVCLQEIQMPEPSQRGGPAPGSQAAAADQGLEKATGGKGKNTMLVAIAGVVVLALVAAVVLLAFRKPATVIASAPASTAPAAVASTPAPAPVPKPAPVSTPVASSDPRPSGILGQCRAIWSFDQSSGNKVVDQTGNGHDGHVRGEGAVWIKAINPDAYGLRMTGSNCVETAGPVVNTAESFTVCARVKLEAWEPQKGQTVVCIDGDNTMGFSLDYMPWYRGEGGRWEFSRADSDSNSAHVVRALEVAGIALNTWYYLVGVYDASAQSISLYQDGKFEAVTSFTNQWQAAGKTVFGGGEWHGKSGPNFTGSIRDVRFYAAALTPDQIKELAR